MATVVITDVDTVHTRRKMKKNNFFKEILEGIPKNLPKKYIYNIQYQCICDECIGYYLQFLEYKYKYRFFCDFR